MTTRAPVRVLVVDDSVVVRRLVVNALSTRPEVEVVGVAANGAIALDKLDQLRPDAVTMDVEMPVMDGIAAVRALRAAGHRLPIVMFSTLTERGAEATLDALAAGADDYVTKPTQTADLQASLQQVADELVPRLVALVERRRLAGLAAGPRSTTPTTPAPTGGRAAPASWTTRPAPSSERPARPVRAVVVGSSTGGPEALSRLMASFGEPLPVPVFLVQHMPPVFTRQLAVRLDRLGPNRVREAEDGDDAEPGLVLVAPGDHHMELVRRGSGLAVRLQQEPPVNFCRPAVDVLVRSAVRALGGDLLAVVLTGMGADGRAGCADVVAAGGQVVVQDEATSVVWGMPGAVAAAGLAHAVVPLERVAAEVVARVVASRRTAPAGGAR